MKKFDSLDSGLQLSDLEDFQKTIAISFCDDYKNLSSLVEYNFDCIIGGSKQRHKLVVKKLFTAMLKEIASLKENKIMYYILFLKTYILLNLGVNNWCTRTRPVGSFESFINICNKQAK